MTSVGCARRTRGLRGRVPRCAGRLGESLRPSIPTGRAATRRTLSVPTPSRIHPRSPIIPGPKPPDCNRLCNSFLVHERAIPQYRDSTGDSPLSARPPNRVELQHSPQQPDSGTENRVCIIPNDRRWRIASFEVMEPTKTGVMRVGAVPVKKRKEGPDCRVRDALNVAGLASLWQ